MPKSAPTNAELLNRIAELLKDESLFSKYRSKFQTDEIEEFLTFLDIEAQRSAADQDIGKLRIQINEAIAKVCEELRFRDGVLQSQRWLEVFCKDVIGRDDVIVDLNYDCFLEGSLDHFDMWSPNGGYPKVIESPFADSFPPNKDRKNVLLYKLHGSENFRLSEMFKKPHQTHIGVALSPEILPKASAHSHFGGGIPDRGTYLIAPSYVKIPHVQIGYMMLEALDHASKSKNLIILGCGMRPEDNFLYLLVTAFLGRNVTGKKMIILSRSAEVVEKRLQAYLSWIHGFDLKVISSSIEQGMGVLAKELN